MLDNERDAVVALETFLQGHETLFYIDFTGIRKYSLKSLPEFTRYALIISPRIQSHLKIAQRVEERKLDIIIRCVLKIKDHRIAVVGDDSGSGHGVGMMKMVQDVETALEDFLEAYDSDLESLGDELENPVDLDDDEKDSEEKEFFYIVSIPFSIRLKSTITKI